MYIASLAELVEHHKSGGIRTLTARHASIRCGYSSLEATNGPRTSSPILVTRAAFISSTEKLNASPPSPVARTLVVVRPRFGGNPAGVECR
jgi:hypothetical protein